MTDDALRAIRERWTPIIRRPWRVDGWDNEGRILLSFPTASESLVETSPEERTALDAAPTDIAALLTHIDEQAWHPGDPQPLYRSRLDASPDSRPTIDPDLPQ